MKTWKPTVAAVLMFLSVLVSGMALMLLRELGIPPLLSILILSGIPAVGIVGALKRKWWNFTLVGSACSILAMPIFGIPAFVLLLRSKDEFQHAY